MDDKILQFELWQECNSNCKFCYSGPDIACTLDAIKIRNLKLAIDKLKDEKTYEEFDGTGFIGGEFFQGQLNNQEVKDLFFELMRVTNEQYKKNLIKKIWINVTLTIGDQKDLYDTLKVFGDIEDLWLLTSYDTKGRFHSQKMEETWKYHMKKLHSLYPKVRLNTTMILSADFIQKYINGDINLKEFMDTYNTNLFFKVPCKVYSTKEQMEQRVSNFFPKRNEFLKFLKKFKDTEDSSLWDKLFNIKYKADLVYRNYKDRIVASVRNKKEALEYCKGDDDVQKEIDEATPKLLPCGHLDSYACYIDSNQCALCDKQYIDNISSD